MIGARFAADRTRVTCTRCSRTLNHRIHPQQNSNGGSASVSASFQISSSLRPKLPRSPRSSGDLRKSPTWTTHYRLSLRSGSSSIFHVFALSAIASLVMWVSWLDVVVQLVTKVLALKVSRISLICCDVHFHVVLKCGCAFFFARRAPHLLRKYPPPTRRLKMQYSRSRAMSSCKPRMGLFASTRSSDCWVRCDFNTCCFS